MGGTLNVDKLNEVQYKLRSCCQSVGRSEGEVKILAVTKKKSVEMMELAYELGVRSFGENYVDEYLDKKKRLSLKTDIDWHFIGQLQSRKIKSVVGTCSLIHSIDRLSQLEELQKRCQAKKLSQDILIQVNTNREASKAGVSPEALPEFLDMIQNLSAVTIRGLMCMPPIGVPEAQSRRSFAVLYDLSKDNSHRLSGSHSLSELSMGTSGDYLNAIKEGSTIVRLGTVLFGQR